MLLMSMGKEFQRVGAATEKRGFFSISQTVMHLASL